MTTLTKVPTEFATSGGGVAAWVVPQKAVADDGQSATITLLRNVSGGPSGFSDWLELWGYDFEDFAAGHTITDVTVVIDGTTVYNSSPQSMVATLAHWDGNKWVEWPYNSSSFAGVHVGAVAAEVLAAWKAGPAIRLKVPQSATGHMHYTLDTVRVTVTFEPPPAPTVTAIDPEAGSIAGGSLVTITGTGFQTDDEEPQDLVTEVSIGGAVCTEVKVASATSLTCKTAAHATGLVNVVVTNAGGNGTLANGFTYLSAIDQVVKVVKAGIVTGTSLHSSDPWPAEPGEQTYGGPNELWAGLTIADVNAPNFGFVLSANTSAGALARVDSMSARFHYSVQGQQDPVSYLSVLRVAADRQTARPELYQLPRGGFSVSNDPTIDRRLSAGAEFRASRRYAPARTVEKICFSREFWMQEIAQAANTPGLQVWARTDERDEFQLLDGSGQPATLRGSGPKEVFFPKGDLARCFYWQVIYRVPALTPGQVPAAYDIRDGVTRILARPKRTDTIPFTLILGGGEFEDRTSMTLSAEQQLARLIDLAGPGRPSILVRDPQGIEFYGSIVGLEYREAQMGEPKANVLVANVKLRVARYE